MSVISMNGKELINFLSDDKNPPLGSRIKSLKEDLKEKNILRAENENKNKLK